MKKIMFLSIVLLQACVGGKTQEQAAKKWDYKDMQKWGDIAIACIEGKMQSPINIETATVVPLTKDLQINYTNIQVDALTNVGYAINALTAPNQTISYNDTMYELLQFHYHVDSEHSVDGVLEPFEIHFVHKDPNNDRLAVIGVFFKEGQHNPAIQELLDNNPQKYGETYNGNIVLPLDSLIPANRQFYSYNGSLTTPACAEIVDWIVVVEPLEMSAEQLAAIRALFDGKTNRKIQELNGRTVNIS